tara:strand:- start:1822 stop:2658 length:837 start_codon:yes stop_codon:yes gene_type:complete
MFRRGGRAGGGIMTGVQRQGYDGEDGKQIVEKNDMEKVAGNMESFNKAFPQYPYAASDFFMNLGTNILAQPGGSSIFETIGKAGVPALQQLQKTRMANTSGQRELALQFWKSMDDDEKDALVNRAEQMVKAGRFKTVAEALQVLVPTYRKDQSPEETEREDILRDEKLATSQIEDLAKIYEIGRTDAVVLNDFMNDLSAGKYKGTYHDPDQYFIEDDDVGRGTDETEKRLVIKDYDPEQSEYKEGRVYIDFLTKIAYVKQGQFLVPYEDYISAKISTD